MNKQNKVIKFPDPDKELETLVNASASIERRRISENKKKEKMVRRFFFNAIGFACLCIGFTALWLLDLISKPVQSVFTFVFLALCYFNIGRYFEASRRMD